MTRFASLTCRLLIFVMLVSTFGGATGGAQEDAPFTIQAEADLQPALEVLYAALYEGAAPVFVEEGGDLLAMTDDEVMAIDAAYDYVYFLYDASLLALSENEDAWAFMDFAVTVEAQMLLIAGGFLPDSVTLTDQGGNEVTIAQPLERILGAYSMGTYYFYAVGARSQLIGASFLGARSDIKKSIMAGIDPRFEEIEGLVEMSQKEINLEEAVALAPDLVVASTRTKWIDAMREVGIPMFLYEGETPEALKEAMLLTGQYLGPNATARAEAWVDYYDWVFDIVTEQTGAVDEAARVRVLFTGSDPLRVASGDMYQTAMIEAAGAISVSADLEGFWNDVNLEQVVVWAPDIILVPSYGGASVEAITESEEWQVLEAVQAGRVYQLPGLVAPWDTPVPDSVLGIVWMANLFYPDLVDLDCATEVTYFYNTWYDYDISEDEVSILCSE